MNRSQVKTVAIVSGLLASTGIALMFGGAVAVIVALTRSSTPWIVAGAAAVVVGLAAYLGARAMARRVTVARREPAPSDPSPR